MTGNEQRGLDALTRPIIEIENRTAQEVFDIMCDRVRLAAIPSPLTHVVGSEERGIGIGMAIAAGIIMRAWGQEVYAREILTTAGFTTLDELKASGVDQFDIDALMPIFAAPATEGSGE